MLTPRTSVPVVGVDGGERRRSGRASSAASSSQSRIRPSAQSVTSLWLDEMSSTWKLPIRSSTLMNAVVSRITEPVPSPFAVGVDDAGVADRAARQVADRDEVAGGQVGGVAGRAVAVVDRAADGHGGVVLGARREQVVAVHRACCRWRSAELEVRARAAAVLRQRAVGPEEAVDLVRASRSPPSLARWTWTVPGPPGGRRGRWLSPTKMSMSSPALIGPNVITKWWRPPAVASAWRMRRDVEDDVVAGVGRDHDQPGQDRLAER